MEIQEAIEAIKTNEISIEGNAVRVAKFLEGLSVANSALKKRIPEKLIHIGNEKCCPDCKEAICNIGDDGCYGYYCLNCGKALDWEDTK